VAGLGFKDFQVGEVLTSSDVDGYLMQQTVMRFADSGARGSALGTAAGTAAALAEGMVSYLDDSNSLEVYTGAAWVGVGGFSASTAITATDAAWAVPTLADPVVRVTVVGGGGGGGDSSSTSGSGASGNSSSFAFAGGTATAAGGAGGLNGNQNPGTVGAPGTDYFAAGNGGEGDNDGAGLNASRSGGAGRGGATTVQYFDLSGVSTVNVTVGAGGGNGGDGVVIVEYRAV